MSSSAQSRTSDTRPTAYWQPLPFFHTGFVIHPYHPLTTPPTTPLAPETSKAAAYRNRFSWSGIPSSGPEGGIGKKGGKVNVYEVPLEIGDEVFAFEEYQAGERDGKVDVWYRGYVVQSVSLSSLNPTPSSSTSSAKPAQYPKPEPSVLIGIFPASCVHIRAESTGEDPALTEAFEKAIQMTGQKEREKDRDKGKGAWIGVNEMDALREEEEDGITDSPERPIKVISNGDTGGNYTEVVDIHPTEFEKVPDRQPGLATNGMMARTNRPKSLVLESRVIAQAANREDESKEQPPLPSLTAGDSTTAGQQWPLVDEISCAIREWYGRLPTYLANREYRLFNTVTQHIDALFLGRRQLLSQALSGDELTRVRRECVSRLVKCNVAQGLEVIVRSLEDGSVMVVDRDRAYSGASWISGITCYIYQLQLAYIDLIPLDALFGKTGSLIAPTQLLGMIPPSSRQNRLSIISSAKGHSRSPSLAHEVPAGSFYHAYLDVRAFVASPCAPGETAELYFSLYNKVESRFITEEFCLILNHLGSPARDPEQRLGRLRTLFTDLKHEDVSSPGSVYLVCRIVRNGAMKIRTEAMAGTLDSHQRNNSVRRTSGNLLDEFGTGRSNVSISETATDDSFSVTSGFGGHRTTTVETSMTTPAGSVLDGRPSFRRPLGCAVLELPSLSKLMSGGDGGGGLEYNIPIYVPSEESGFANLHEDIIGRRTRAYLKSSKAEAIAISLRVFSGIASQLIREHPSTLVDTPLSSRLGFADVGYPGSFRNDIYVKLGSGSFSPAPASSGGSIRRKPVAATNTGDVQVTIEVKRNDGSTVYDAIYPGGSGESPLSQYNSLVYHHNDRPTFGDCIKVSIPSRVTDCHLFLTFRSRGKEKSSYPDANEAERPFAFAYLPLLGSTTVADGDHHLALYRTEKSSVASPNVYFGAPVLASQSTVALRPHLAKTITQIRDRLTVKTILCSNLHSQDDTLRTLFRWQGLVANPEDLANMLQMFGFVGEAEIAKFVPPVFDSLFGISASSIGERQDEIDDLVFKSLTRVLSMVTDRRYPNFKPVLDIYIDQHFNHPAASSRLLRSMRNVMAQPDTKEYRGFLKVWYLFFRFIVRSRELDRARGSGLDATSAHIEADFQRQTKVILGEINNLMKSDDKGLIGTQTLAVQHYADILPNLSQVFRPLEIAEIIIAFVDTMAFVKGNIAIFKLLLLLAVIRTVFDTVEARALLVPALVRWVKPHLGRYEDADIGGDENGKDVRKVKWLECNRLAVTVVAMMVNKLQEWGCSPLILEDQKLRLQEEDNIEYCLSLLPNLLASYMELSSNLTTSLLSRHRTSAIYKPTPDIFPMTLTFTLISDLPPPSLLDKTNVTGEDGLASPGTYVSGLAECATVVITLILATPRRNILNWLVETLDIEGIRAASRTMRSIFDFCYSLIRFEAFPKQWLTLSLMSFRGVLRLLDPIAELLDREAFIPDRKATDRFDVELWMSCFGLLCELCGSDELALEDHTQQRRRAEWIIAGDLRVEGAGLLLRLWNAIGWPASDAEKNGHAGDLKYGGYQTRFTSLAGKVLGLCLSSHDQMCETAVEILFSMIYAEYVLVGNFDTIETEIYAKLEVLFTRTTPSSDPTMRAYFVAQLRSVFEASPEIDTSFHHRVATFLDSLELFIDLLLSLRDIPETAEWKDERSTATYRLMQFTKQIGRQDLYIRFIHQLVDIAVESRDWISAGLALKLHAECYVWNLGGDMVDEFDAGRITLPAQSGFARKEALSYHAVEYLAEAEAHEHALEICQELTVQHQRLTFHVPKLSELLNHQARLWEKIAESSRPRPEYFRVAYFGDMTPLNQGKDYIVRGRPWQRYSDFCETIQHKFPDSSIYHSKIPPSEATRNGSDQVIWITSVEPRPDLTRPVLEELASVGDNVQSWWRHNEIKRFTSDRPYLKDAGETEAVMSWVERTVLTTADELPGVLNRSEIVHIEYEQISPVENAVSEVQKATTTLSSLTTRKRDEDVDVKYLGTAINGAVDSPVSGGVKLYRSAFLEGAYLQIHRGDSALVERLRGEIVAYVTAIQGALVVHRRVCRDLAFHEALKSHFVKAFPDELAQLPRGPDSSDSHINTSPANRSIPRINGHNGNELDLDERPLPTLPSDKAVHPARLSTMSTNSTAAYILPLLRLGPSPVPLPLTSPPIIDMSSLNLRRPPSAPTSPRNSTITSRSSEKGTSIGTRSNQTSPAGTPGLVMPSLGSRALSLVGSARSGSRDSRIETESIISEGTVEGEVVNPQPGEGLGVGMGREKVKVKGLKRFSSLMRGSTG